MPETAPVEPVDMLPEITSGGRYYRESNGTLRKEEPAKPNQPAVPAAANEAEGLESSAPDTPRRRTR